MKDDNFSLQEQLNNANDKSRHLERQLHDKERELKRILVELNDAHTSNRQLQVRIDELREEINIYVPTTPGTALRQTQFDFSFHDNNDNTLKRSPIKQNKSSESNEESVHIDLQNNLLINDMSGELTLRCYKSLLNTVSNCHQHLFQLKQEMWEIYQHIQLVNSVLRNFLKNQNDGSEKDSTESQIDESDVQSPGPLNLSNALTDLSSFVQKLTTSKGLNTGEDNTTKELKKKLETLVRERDEAISSRNVLEVSLSNAKVDLKSVNGQLLRTIQQKLAHQKELEVWQEDMELMVQGNVNLPTGLRRVNSLHHSRESSRTQTSNRNSLFLPFRRSADDSATPSKPSEQNTKSPGFFTSWLKRKLTQSSVSSSPAKGSNS